MMWIEAARAIGGLVAIVVLLGLVAARSFDPTGVAVDVPTIALLLSLVSGLLGVDIATDKLPFTLEVKRNDGDDGDG